MNKKKIILISVAVFVVVSLIVTAIVLTNYKAFDVQYNAKDSTVTITYLGFVPMTCRLYGDVSQFDGSPIEIDFTHNSSVTMKLFPSDLQIDGLKHGFSISERLEKSFERRISPYFIWSDGSITNELP